MTLWQRIQTLVIRNLCFVVAFILVRLLLTHSTVIYVVK